jgi:outer membrane immunogenic protein
LTRPSTVSGGRSLTGYAVGGGVAWALGNNWVARAEYLYIDLDNASLTDAVGTTATFDNAFHTMRVSVNYKF